MAWKPSLRLPQFLKTLFFNPIQRRIVGYTQGRLTLVTNGNEVVQRELNKYLAG